MKKYNYQLNCNSLLFKCVTDILYLAPALIAFLIFQIFQIKSNISLFIVILYITIVEFIHYFKHSNSTLIDWFYRLKHIMIKNHKQIFHLYIYEKLKYAHILFLLYTILFFTRPITTNNNTADLTNFISTIITVTSIILTLIFGLLQQLQNNFSDSISLINEWKKNIIYFFIILTLYTILGLSDKYFNLNIISWTYTCSIYIILQLSILAIECLNVMNGTGIIDINKYKVLKVIDKAPEEKILTEILRDFSNKSIKNKLKKWIYINLIGIIPNDISGITFANYVNNEIKTYIESIFRITNIYIQQDKFILYKNSICAIIEIYTKIILKTKGNHNFEIYEYLVLKYSEMKNTILKDDKELYLQELSELLLCITKKSINIARNEYNQLSNSTSILYLVDEITKLIQQISHYQHTTVAPSLIIELGTLTQLLLNKKDTPITQTILEKLKDLAIDIPSKYLKLKHKYNSIWITKLIAKIMYSTVNTIFFIISNYPELLNNTYFFKTLKETYLTIFKIYSSFSYSNDNPFVSLCNLSNTNFILFYNVVEKNIKVKTPYKNIIITGAMKPINNVSCLYEIFALTFISDIYSNTNFKNSISCLIKLLDIIKDIDVKINDTLSLNNLCDFYENIIKALNIFISRIIYFNINLVENNQIIKIFIEKLLEVSFVHFKKYYENVLSYDYIDFYLNFLYEIYVGYNGQFITETNITDILNKIIKLYNSQKNKNIQGKIYNSLNLFYYNLFKDNKNNNSFNEVLNCIVQNIENHQQIYMSQDYSNFLDKKRMKP